LSLDGTVIERVDADAQAIDAPPGE